MFVVDVLPDGWFVKSKVTGPSTSADQRGNLAAVKDPRALPIRYVTSINGTTGTRMLGMLLASTLSANVMSASAFCHYCSRIVSVGRRIGSPCNDEIK